MDHRFDRQQRSGRRQARSHKSQCGTSINFGFSAGKMGMSQELIYTSAATGLKPGSKGFCTVAITAGLPTGWIDRLEPLSAYRAVYPLGDPKSDRNPINFSHWRVAVAGKSKSVLSRVAFAGADYSGRSNKLAHHIMLEAAEQAAGGPAWMMLKAGLMRTTWAGAPQQFPAGPKLPAGDRGAGVCATWASVRGDAGWAGALAESFITEPAKPVYLVYSPGTDVLRLFDESLSLLPPAKRWDVTFSTFFTELPLNLSCAWRAVVSGTPAATEAMRLGPRALVLDLTKPAATQPTGAYADGARTGRGPVVTGTAARTAPVLSKISLAAAPPVDPDDSGIADIPFQTESVTAPVRGRKRLASAVDSDSLESEIAVEEMAEDERGSKAPKLAVVKHGVPAWVFIVSTVGCLMFATAGSILTYSLSMRRFKSSESAMAQAKRDSDEAKQHAEEAIRNHSEFKDLKTSMEDARNATGANVEVLTKSESDDKVQIGKLQQQVADLSSKLDSAPARINGADLQAQLALIPGKFDAVNTRLEILEKRSTGNQGTSSDGVASSNQIPFQASVTGISFAGSKDAFSSDAERTMDIDLPSGWPSPTKLSILWPNGLSEFDVTADRMPYHISSKADGLKLTLQTTVLDAMGPKLDDIFTIEAVEGKLRLSEIKPINATAAKVVSIMESALGYSAFAFETNGSVKRLSLHCGGPAELTNIDNIFALPKLPERSTLADLRVDGSFGDSRTFHDWVLSQVSSPTVFLHPQSTAQFTVSIESVANKHENGKGDQMHIAIDIQLLVDVHGKLKQKQADKQKEDDRANTSSGAEKHKAEERGKTIQGDVDKLNTQWNSLSSAYNSLNGSFPVCLRLPNGVEVKRLTLTLPKLPD
jgi:hypothetical protein